MASLISMAAKVIEHIQDGRQSLMGAKSLTLTGFDGFTPINAGAASSALFHRYPDTDIDYARLAGDLWRNSAVQACLNLIIAAFAEAPPCVKKRKDAKNWVVDENHPLTELLMNPADGAYDDTVFWAGTNIGTFCNGNAYGLIERNKYNLPCRIWYVPHYMMLPRRDQGSRQWITHYDYFINGRVERVDPRNVLHFRFGVDPYYPLLGLSLWASANREIYIDNVATQYQGNILRNPSVFGGIVSPKENSAAEFDPVGFMELVESKNRGDGQGRLIAQNASLDWKFPENTPEKMAIPTAHRIPESRICALVRISPMAVGLEVGLEHSTYSNMEEAVRGAWHHCILPTERIYARQMTAQLGPQFGLVNGRQKIGFDTSDIRALQDDKTSTHTMAREDFKANLIDRATAKVMIGEDPLPEDVGVYYADLTSTQPDDPVQDGDPNAAPAPDPTKPPRAKNAKKALDLLDYEDHPTWIERIVGEMEAMDLAMQGAA